MLAADHLLITLKTSSVGAWSKWIVHGKHSTRQASLESDLQSCSSMICLV